MKFLTQGLLSARSTMSTPSPVSFPSSSISNASEMKSSKPNSFLIILAAMSMPPLTMTHFMPASCRDVTVSWMPLMSGTFWKMPMRSFTQRSGFTFFQVPMSLRMNSLSVISWLMNAL